MKKIFFLLAFGCFYAHGQMQYLSGIVNTSVDTTTFQRNVVTMAVLTKARASTTGPGSYMRWSFKHVWFDQYIPGRNDGRVTGGIYWPDAAGRVKMSPLDSLLLKVQNIPGLQDSLNARPRIALANIMTVTRASDSLNVTLGRINTKLNAADTNGNWKSAAWLPSWAQVTGSPTVVSYFTNDAGYLTSVPAQSFGSLTGKPTTLAGYGITDAYPLSSNPAGYIANISGFNTSDLAEGSNLYYTATRFNTAFSGKTTTDLTEGTNQYFTTARARVSISSGSGLSYNSSTGVISSTALVYSAGTGISISGSGVVSATGGTGTVTSVNLSSSGDLVFSGGPITTSGTIAANLSTTGVTAGTYDWVTVDTKGRVTAAANSPVPTAIASGARNLNQAYQVSATRPAFISVSPAISCNLSLSGGQAGNAQLQISANGSTGWIVVGVLQSSNTGTLTIGLNTTQISGAPMDVALPAGYYWRIATTNTTGTPTFTFNGGYELIF